MSYVHRAGTVHQCRHCRHCAPVQALCIRIFNSLLALCLLWITNSWTVVRCLRHQKTGREQVTHFKLQKVMSFCSASYILTCKFPQLAYLFWSDRDLIRLQCSTRLAKHAWLALSLINHLDNVATRWLWRRKLVRHDYVYIIVFITTTVTTVNVNK